MKLVVDTNILITYFWSSSAFRSLATKQELELVSPEFALEEINNHRDEIIRKAKITPKDFQRARGDLAVCVEFIPLEEYSSFLPQAKLLIDSLDEKHQKELGEDIDFISLAIMKECPLWTHDKLLSIQQKIKIISTKEVINQIFNGL